MKNHLLSLSALIASTALPAWAQQTNQLEEITVTAPRLEQNLPQILATQGVRVDTIPADEILKRGYIDIAQSLQALAPGLYLSPKNGPFDYVDGSFQGSRTSDILWLVDGVRINNRLYAGTTPLDTLPAAMVERIELLEGGQALFYGTQGVAGAINVVTKEFTETPDGAVSLGGDTNGSGHVDGYFRDSLGRNHFVVYADMDISEGFQPFRTRDYQPSSTDRNRAYSVYTVGAKYALDFTDDLRFSTMYQFDNAKLDDSAPQLVQQAHNERDEHIVSGKIDYTPSDAMQFFAKGYYHRWAAHYTEYDNVVGSPGQLETIEDHGPWGFTDAGVNLMGKVQLFPGLDAIAGYDYQGYDGSDAVLVITEKTEDVHAFFGQLGTNKDLFENGTIAAGFRYNDPSAGPSKTVWDVSGRYDLTGDLFVRGLVGTAFRLPTAEELFANDPFDERGNPDLKPEESFNVNASIGGTVDDRHYRWEVIGFLRNIKNLIDYATFDEQTDQDVFGNVPGMVRVRGAELDLGADFTDWSASLNYTYSHSVNGNNLQIDRIPVHELKATAEYHPDGQPFDLTATLLFVGNIYRSNLIDGREDYGNYPVLDISGRVYLDEDRKNIITARLENVFDKTYASGLGNAFPDDGGNRYTDWNLGVPRTFSLRYTYKF
ncbi:MAG TPA: TonB-dependent receptor [Alphaproteobacteria bacterium]|nr:TonB-dependent receptor [Alphaproteobacteria bacterium]